MKERNDNAPDPCPTDGEAGAVDILLIGRVNVAASRLWFLGMNRVGGSGVQPIGGIVLWATALGKLVRCKSRSNAVILTVRLFF
jgi:hypothetical protein